MTTAVVTTRISENAATALEALARDIDRPRSWVVARAIERYVAEESALIAAIREGEADIDAGRVRDQDAVEAMFGVKRDRRHAA